MPLKKNRAELAFVIAITAIGAFLRFYRIGKECLWFDEIYVLGRVSNTFGGIVDDLLSELGILFPPLYFFMLRVWVSLVGLGPLAIRSFSALWGIAAIPVAYLLAREMFGKRAAVVSSILLVFSAFSIYYSQEGKMYAMWWTLALISILFFVRAVKYGARWCDLSLYIAASAASLWVHNFPALVILSQMIYLVAIVKPRERVGRWLLVYALMVILSCSWVSFFLARIIAHPPAGGMGEVMALTRMGFEWIPTPIFRTFFMSFVIFSSGMQLYAYDLDTWMISWHKPFPAAPWLCVLALALALYPILRRRPDDCRFSWLVAILIIFPSVSVFLYSRLVKSVWHPRYLGFIAPLIFIAIGYGYSLSDRKLITGTAVGILLLLNLSVLDFYYSDRVKMPWDDLVVYLAPRVESGTCILFPYVELRTSLEYYWNLDDERRKKALNLESPFAGDDELGERIKDFDDVWLVVHYSIPRGRRRPLSARIYVPGYRPERMYFGNGLEIIHYVRKREGKDGPAEKQG